MLWFLGNNWDSEESNSVRRKRKAGHNGTGSEEFVRNYLRKVVISGKGLKYKTLIRWTQRGRYVVVLASGVWSAEVKLKLTFLSILCYVIDWIIPSFHEFTNEIKKNIPCWRNFC